MKTSATVGLMTILLLAGSAGAQHNTLTDAERAAGWVLLFDGATLDGWTNSVGDMAAWTVEDGCIATTGSGGGWWLRTEKMYRDFEVKLDFQIPPGGNSGVGVRGSSWGDPAFTGMEIQIYDTYGQEVQFGSAGAIYNAIKPREQAIRPAGEWNTYHIKLVGDAIDIWMNGVHIVDDERLDDRGYFRAPEQRLPLRDRLQTGYIALQDHGRTVRFRNLKVLDYSPDPDPGDWTPIFNGRDLDGWHARGDGTWTVEGGTLVGRDGAGHLFTDRTWSDVEIRAMVRVNEDGNSGLYFRTVPNPEDPDSWPVGYEAQVDQHDPRNFTGVVYNRAWGEMPATRDGAWFDYRVRAVGNHIQTWVNGSLVVDAELDDFTEGHIALQAHNPGNLVEWRDIQVRVPAEGDE